MNEYLKESLKEEENTMSTSGTAAIIRQSAEPHTHATRVQAAKPIGFAPHRAAGLLAMAELSYRYLPGVALLQLQLQLRFLSAEVSVTNLESKKLFPYISKYQYKKNLPIPLFYKQTEVGCIRAELMNGRSHSYVYNVRSIT